uniref:Expressed protein n=1 Tax=Echinococcus granulosus TaxID=6210 RepID=A0A068X199_ECHGR|nr:expressed protein [Echinococcus granulosus]
MAPLLVTTATCVCRDAPLKDKSLQEVAGNGLREANDPPSYKVKVTNSKVSFKSTSKGAKKLEPLEFQKVNDMYVIEESDVIAFSLSHKKDPTCLALKFNDTNSRKKFQTLANTSISNTKKSKSKEKKNKNKKEKKKKSKSKEAQQNKASEESKPESTLEPPRERSGNSTVTMSDVKASQRSRRPSSSRTINDEGRQYRRSPSVKDGSSVCSHCHQKLPNRMMASRIEYDPPHHLQSHSPRSQARSYNFSRSSSNGSVYYIGPRKMYHRSHIRDSPSDAWTNESTESLSTSITTTPTDGHFVKVDKVPYRTPVSYRKSSPRLKTSVLEPTSKRHNSKRSKSQPNVFYLWDSSSDEGDESDDYRSNSTSSDDSVSSYNNVIPSVEFARSKKIEKLLQELGKPGAIRLY